MLYTMRKYSDNLKQSIERSALLMRRAGGNGKRARNRLVQKGGHCNITLVNVPSQGRKYFSDIFTTLIDIRWRWCIGLFAATYTASWVLFGIMFYLVPVPDPVNALVWDCPLVSAVNGDFASYERLLAKANNGSSAADMLAHVPCIQNVNTTMPFLSVLMFSVESQSTIGYGWRFPTERCPIVVLTVMLQNMIGVVLQTVMAGIVFAKLARPKKRADTLVFSKEAVICMRDGRLCFLFRVGDMRKTQLAEAHVRLQMIKKLVTSEGELQPFHQYDMDVGYDEGLDRVFVMWPITVCHVIDEDSPLYNMSKEDLASARFEIIAILEGVVETTGSTTQAITSYLPSEILWGRRFQKLVTYQRYNGQYSIDFGLFHGTYHVPCTDLSSKQLDELKEAGADPTELWTAQVNVQ